MKGLLLLLGFLAAFGVLFLVERGSWAQPAPPRGQFGLSMLSVEGGGRVDPDDFYLNDDCALCHQRQYEEMQGSFHSVAHVEPFYRAFAELARKEAGEEIYAYCTGCHSPVAVASGLVPGKHDPELPEVAKAGVTCDVCHQMSRITGHDGPWKEPGNASFALKPGRVKFGSIGDIKRNPAHKGQAKDFYSKSEYCAGCHTIIHPLNGLRIEHTYEEWKKSPYAENGIQCQDCHMRSVEDAIKVAETMAPVKVTGKFIAKGPEREIQPHYFVGGNSNAEILTGSAKHAEMARKRLKSAAELTISVPETAKAGETGPVEVTIRNIGAGHNLPTSLTELREMWVRIRATSEDGSILWESGGLDERGDIRDGAIRFGAVLLDAAGKKTYRPWAGVGFAWKRTIPPKEAVTETVEIRLPAGTTGKVTVKATLLYRSAPPAVVREVMGKDAFVPEIVEMATTSAEMNVE